MIGALADWFAVVARFRRSFDDFVRNLIVKLKTDPLYRLKGGQVRDQLLASPAVGEYLQEMWAQLRDWLKSDLASADSSIKAQVNSAVLDVGKETERRSADHAVAQRNRRAHGDMRQSNETGRRPESSLRTREAHGTTATWWSRSNSISAKTCSTSGSTARW